MSEVIQHDEQKHWDRLVKASQGHPLQLWGWGEVKRAYGWNVERLQVGQGGAQVLVKRLPKPFGPLVYVPRGPFGTMISSDEERDSLVRYIKKTYRPTVLTVEPDGTALLTWRGWKKSANRVLLSRTAVMDLTKREEELLSVMSKKTRQYIRKSAGEGVSVEQVKTVSELDECLAIYKNTAERAGFALHDDSYYHDVFTNLGTDSPVFVARSEGRAVAFLWPIVTPEVAFELYGGMSEEGQALRANYHLKWSVIQYMKRQGVKRYDVNGLLNDGVSAFKKGFIPDETMMSGTYDKPLSPLYAAWSVLLPTAKRIVQRLR